MWKTWEKVVRFFGGFFYVLLGSSTKLNWRGNVCKGCLTVVLCTQANSLATIWGLFVQWPLQQMDEPVTCRHNCTRNTTNTLHRRSLAGQGVFGGHTTLSTFCTNLVTLIKDKCNHDHNVEKCKIGQSPLLWLLKPQHEKKRKWSDQYWVHKWRIGTYLLLHEYDMNEWVNLGFLQDLCKFVYLFSSCF